MERRGHSGAKFDQLLPVGRRQLDEPGSVRSYRLFLAPGMDHCGGGVGPNAIGGVPLGFSVIENKRVTDKIS
jgi:hypothetical protein